LLTLINPEILSAEGGTGEAAWSVPGYFDRVRRAARIRFPAR
jgi:peptide deformylase